VTEVGTQAVLRSSGLASTQSTTGNQEAKDFKVVVTVQNPPDGLRPGLSSTAKIAYGGKEKRSDGFRFRRLAERTKKIWTRRQKKTGKIPSRWRPAAPLLAPAKRRNYFLLRPRKESGDSGRLCGSE